MSYAIFRPAEQAERPRLLFQPLVDWLWLLLIELEKLAPQLQEQRRTAMRGQRGASLAKKGAKPSDTTDAKYSNKHKTWQAERQKEYLTTSIQLEHVAHEISKRRSP